MRLVLLLLFCVHLRSSADYLVNDVGWLYQLNLLRVQFLKGHISTGSQCAIRSLKHLSDVPADEVCLWIIGLPLRKVNFFAVKPHQPFLKAN